MKRRQQSLKFAELYIEPVAVCNLDCAVCYTDRTPKTRLSTQDMLSFAVKQDAYERQYSSMGLRLVSFCGTGEVFVLKDFPETLRAFHRRFPEIVFEVQTNGTFPFPELDFPVGWNISLDGTHKYHEMNRGPDTFKRTVHFLEAALAKGDDVRVRTIVGAWNEKNVPRFKRWLAENYGLEPDFTPRGHTPGIELPLYRPGYTQKDALGIASKKSCRVYLGSFHLEPGACHQVSIFHNHKVSFCCEAPVLPATLDMSMREVEDEYMKLIGPCRACHVNRSCWWCIEPRYNCGAQELLELSSCKDVAEWLASGEIGGDD